MATRPDAEPEKSLEDLPPELRGLIAQRLDKLEDLRALAATSRAMRNSTDPLFFQHICLSDMINSRVMGGIKPIKLLRSLVEQPHLRKYVQSLTSLYIEEHFECNISALTAADHQYIVQARAVCAFNYNQSEDSGFNHHHFAFVLALILQLCSNIKELNLGMGQVNCDCCRASLETWLPKMRADAVSTPQDGEHRKNANREPLLSKVNAALETFRRAPTMQPLADGTVPFSRLRSVALWPGSGAINVARWKIGNASALFRLPSLESVYISTATFKVNSEIEAGGPPWACPENTSNVKEITLDYCELDTDTLCKMIESCKALVRFDANICNGLVGPDQLQWECGVDWAEVSLALENHQDTLQELLLRSGVWLGTSSNILEPNDQPIGSLKSFHRLNLLVLEESVMFGRTDGVINERDYREGGQGDFSIMEQLPPTLIQFIFQSTIRNSSIAAALKQLAVGLISRRDMHSIILTSFKYLDPSANDLVESLRIAFPSIEFKVVNELTDGSDGEYWIELTRKRDEKWIIDRFPYLHRWLGIGWPF